MATVEIELRPYVKRDGTQPLVLRITSGNKVSRKNTGLYVTAEQWNADKRQVNRKHSAFARINDAIAALISEAEGLKADAIKVGERPAPDNILAQMFTEQDFYKAAEAYSAAQKKFNYSKSFDAVVSVMKKYKANVNVHDITPRFLEDYRRWLIGKGKSRNTVISHFNRIQTVLGSLSLNTRSPFEKITVGSFKRAKSPELVMEDIQKIRDYAPRNRGETNAKDTFLFSFFAAGMRSSDVLQLRWSNIVGDRIVFDPNKTKDSSEQALSIPLNAVTRGILEGRDRTTKTVFNLLTHFGDGKIAVKERGSVQSVIRGSLKDIVIHGGIGKPLTFKMARTAFAQIANEASQRNVYGIQQAMGHSKMATTEIYLGSDNRAIDELLQVVYK